MTQNGSGSAGLLIPHLGGRLREAYPAISAAAEAAVARLAPKAGGGPVDIEAETSFWISRRRPALLLRM